MPVDPHPFGRALRRIREAQKINQEEAAERCGLHRTYYSGVERGIRNVSLVNIEKIAKGLKRSLPELFSRIRVLIPSRWQRLKL
jgi:transcriptional regulator with XRE-family HTH domain